MAYEKFSSPGYHQKSNKYAVIDIEVIPEKFDSDEVSEYLMDKNFPRKIHPLFSKILLIGIKHVNEKIEIIHSDDEKEVLNRFWTRIKELKPDIIVTFNGYNFDIPFLNIRSNVKGIKPTMDINLVKWKYETSNHFDCMQVLSANQTFLNVALEISCRVFKIPVPENRVSGEEVPKLYAKAEVETIKEHCRQDVEMAEQLYLKLKK
jgi:DNA polymerase elongation subunit (family B)